MCQLGPVVSRIKVSKDKPVYAYRGFCYSTSHGELDHFSLLPVSHPGPSYTTGTNVASYPPTKRGDHDMAGFWAFSWYHRNHCSRFGNIRAVVKMWGRVVTHTLGYRSEFLEIVAIEGVPVPQTLAGAAYNVPVASLDSMATLFPQLNDAPSGVSLDKKPAKKVKRKFKRKRGK
jgi:hypothetical protein